MAMVALVADGVVDFSQVGIRRRVRFEQHKGIGAARAAWGFVFKVHTVRLYAGKGGDERTINRVGVPLVDGRVLVARTQSKVFIRLLVSARHGHPAVQVDHVDNARYRLR
ncbi:hypothetical protein D3C76_1606470 [compost metagenome]